MFRCWFNPGVPHGGFYATAPEQMTLVIQNTPDTLRQMRAMRFETDIILNVQLQLFYAHKHVLASASSYFYRIFREDPTGGGMMVINDVSPALMSRLLDSFYGEPLLLNLGTAPDLLHAAVKFGLASVVAQCCQYLQRQLHPVNAVGIWKLSRRFECAALDAEAYSFIRRHFVQVSRTQDFRNLEPDLVRLIIADDHLNVAQESEVFSAVTTWVSADRNGRCKFLLNMFEQLRCELLTRTYLRCCISSDLVKSVPGCLDILQSVHDNHFGAASPDAKQRTPDVPGFIYVAGGEDSDDLDVVEAYNVDERSWTTVCRVGSRQLRLAGVVFRRIFYVVGNSRRFQLVKQVRDPANDVCRDIYLGLHDRDSSSVAVLDGYIYIIGGTQYGLLQRSVLRQDPQVDSWEEVSPLTVGTKAAAVAVLDNQLYVIGGLGVIGSLRTVVCYNPGQDAWQAVAPLNIGRHAAGAAVLNGCIYVAGGCEGSLTLSSVEKYDRQNSIWEYVRRMCVARAELTLTEARGKLYAIGGFDNTFEALASMEIYDPDRDEWVEGAPLAKGRGGHAAGLMYRECAVHSYEF